MDSPPKRCCTYTSFPPNVVHIRTKMTPNILNACADILYPLSKGNLYYYCRKSGLEVDFVMEMNGKVCLIEVKSSGNPKSKSLSTAMKDYPDSIGLRCSYRNNGKADRLWSLPLYMLQFIDRILEDDRQS